jgi:hypothetical protein
MTAKEWFKQQYPELAGYLTEDDIITLMESYHQFKSKEEAEERYRIGKDYFNNKKGHYNYFVDKALRLAAFGKEDNQ